jgi:HEAT repeats
MSKCPRTQCCAVVFCGVLIAVATCFSGTSADAQGPDEKRAIQRGVDYLRTVLKPSNGSYSAGGAYTLAAYAMLKGGATPRDPVVAGIIAGLKKRLADGTYQSSGKGIYEAGCELMLLEAATPHGKPTTYHKEMQLIVDYIVKNQDPKGYWNYLHGDMYGDCSVTQYGILGLWAAERVGIKVPRAAYDKAAAWLMVSNQDNRGGFSYRPSRDGKAATLSMTVAGTSSLLIARRYLYPSQAAGLREKKPTPKKRGVVEIVDIDTEISKGKGGKKKVETRYRPNIPFGRLTGSAMLGLNWVKANYQRGDWPYYTLYGVERMAALARLRTIGNTDWYAEGSAYLLKNQQDSTGGWTSRREGTIPATSFAILFLGRATSKILGEVPPDLLGDGLLRGGRGLPTDLSTIEEGQGGAIKKRTSLGPIDDLLAELQKPEKLEVPEVQKAIVEKIQLGDRKQWLQPGRRKQLLRMANHKSPEVRKVAVWALGRTGNIDVASVLMDALENDPDVDVAVEARNALCWLARRPNGFGTPETPKYPPGATKSQRRRAADEWRSAAVGRWKKWYLQVRPYRERDDLKETGAPAKPGQ